METLTQTPTVEFGVEVLDDFNNEAAQIIDEFKKVRNRTFIFEQIFRSDLVKHLLSAYKAKDEFGLFWLNLDDKCKTRLLQRMGISLLWPEVPNLQELAGKYKMDPDIHGDVSGHVRYLSISFKDHTDWEVLPHNLIFINRFVLYANNHGIDAYLFQDERTKQFIEDYKGERYGQYTNWLKLWQKSPADVRQKIVENLMSYR